MTILMWLVNNSVGINEGVKNPSLYDINHWLNSMDNQRRFYFNIETPSTFITLINVNKDRVKFIFEEHSKEKERSGILIDPLFSVEDGEIEFEGDPTEESIHIYITITKTKAYDVISYFLENKTLPEGLRWLVLMGEF